MIGIIIYLIGGLGAGLMPNFYMLLAMRGLLGVGCGLITPMAQALISSNFTGELRERLTSYSASASYLMGIMASYLVGKLVGISWRLCFTIYFVAAVVLILNVVYLPAQNRGEIRSTGKTQAVHQTNYKAYFLIICMALINLAFYTFSASISLFMRSEGIGDETSSGVIVSGFMICGFLVGLVVTNIRKLAGYYTMAVGCLMMASGYGGLFLSKQMLAILAFAGLIGGSYSILYSGIFSGIRNVSRNQAENTKLITYTTAGMFAGQAVSQYVLRGIEHIIGMSGYRFRFLVLAVGLFIGAAGVIIYQTMSHSRKGADSYD